MPGLLATVLPEPRDLTGEKLWGREAQVGERRRLGTSEALASAPWLQNKIVQRTQWAHYLEANKTFIIQALT